MDDVVRSLERAVGFIHRVATGDGAPPKSGLEGLMGLAVCRRAGVGAACRPLRETAARVVETLDAADAFEPYDHDAKLLLVCLREIREQGLEPPEVLARFALEVGAGLRALETVPHHLAVEAYLTAAVDHPAVRNGSHPPTRSPVEGHLFEADPSELRRLANWVASATRFGTAPLPQALADELLTWLPVLLLQKLREYDLVLGSALLRAVEYLADGSAPESGFAAEFLLTQQQPDGRFGYFARELSEGPRIQDPDRELFLPVTVSAVWALAVQGVPGFRLLEG